MVRGALALVGSFGGAWVALVAYMSMMENRFIYFPARRLDAEPRTYGLTADELAITASDGVRLHGWWIRGRGDRVVLLFHGNAGNVSHRLDRAKLFVDRLGVDLLLVDYRGYGRSEGKPSEAGLYRDGLAIYDAARAKGFGAERIVLMGESLGCAVAAQVASARPAAGLVLETPFLSVPALAKKFYPFVPTFLIRSRYDTESKIRKLTLPKLVVAAQNDDIAPPAHARKLYEIAPPPKELLTVPGAGHNDLYVVGGERYLDAWRKFLATLPAR